MKTARVWPVRALPVAKRLPYCAGVRRPIGSDHELRCHARRAFAQEDATDVTLSAEEQESLTLRVARTRDRDAFAALFDHFAPRLKGYLQRLGLDAGAAEEIVQETMIVLWHKAGLFDPRKSSLATWLYRVARNRRIDLARRQAARSFDQLDPTLQPEAMEEPGAALDARARGERVRAALAGLPDDQREAVRLAFFAGLSHSEISARTGLPMGTVKSRIRLAFGRLRQALEEDPRVDTD
jgi:RNA polymerase sigma-70 factor (ECF subfamily)